MRVPDGSYLSQIYPPERDRRRGSNCMAVRVIEYRLEGVTHVVVAFEADRIHPGSGGWSVFVTGIARHLGRESRRDTYRVVSLSPDMVSGRRIDGMPMIEPINLAAPAIRPASPDCFVAGQS